MSDSVEPSATVQVRFRTSDFDPSVTEAGIDDFQVTRLGCAATLALVALGGTLLRRRRLPARTTSSAP